MSIENLGRCLHRGSYTPGSVFAHKFGYSSISTPSYVSASSVIGCCIHKYWISGSSGGFKYCWFSYI